MASKGGRENLDDLLEPDYDHIYFGDEAEDDDHHPKKPDAKTEGKKQLDGKEDTEPSDPPYILGTLIVRVVAARDLQPTHDGGIGGFLFGNKGGSANPYCSVKFGTSTQRTSDLYDTLDPVWPRGETMFMDVSLPLSKTSHPDPTLPPAAALTTSPSPTTSSDSSAGIIVWGSQSDASTAAVDPMVQDGNPIPEIQPMDPSGVSVMHSNPKTHNDSIDSLDVPQPILTLAIFSSEISGKKSNNNERYPNKKGLSGDSDDEFLGMTSVDLTSVLTGKRSIVDAWLPLAGGTGSVRITCEYETTDCAPEKGDLVRFSRFCHPADLHPLVPGRIYPVQEVIDKDHVLLSYNSPEGWICSFLVHRFMVLCVERHHGAVEACREEWQSITERLTHSPLVGTVTQTVAQLPEEGLFAVGANVLQGGANVLGRWLEGGLDTAVKDVAFATNWDGRFNPGLDSRASGGDDTNNDGNQQEGNGEATTQAESQEETDSPITLPEVSPKLSSEKDPLPNMPSCPITGEPMLDPVVAADGHTYERAAIARWLQTSDKSPLTGSVLHHKELVPNYGLLSSLQEQADAFKKKAPPVAAKAPPKHSESLPEPDATAKTVDAASVAEAEMVTNGTERTTEHDTNPSANVVETENEADGVVENEGVEETDAEGKVEDEVA